MERYPETIVLYMRQFKDLIALTMFGNPCAFDPEFKDSMAAFVPNLIYFDYKKIKPKERSNGRTINLAELKDIELAEDEQRKREEKERLQREKKEKLVLIFMDGYEEHGLYESLFENDPDGKAFMEFGDDIYYVFNRFKMELRSICNEFMEVAEEYYEKRMNEVSEFENAWERNMENTTTQMHNHTEEVMRKQFSYLNELKTLLKQKKGNDDETDIRRSIRLRDILTEYGNFMKSKWFSLMDIEMKRNEKNEDMITLYERMLMEIINTYVETAQGYYRRMRDAELDFMESMMDQLSVIVAELIQPGDEFISVSPVLRPYVESKEALINGVLTMHEEHLLRIDNKEDHLAQKLKQWHTSICGDLAVNEMKRNREAVFRIKKYVEFSLKEFCKLGEGSLEIIKNLKTRNELIKDLKQILKKKRKPLPGKRKGTLPVGKSLIKPTLTKKFSKHVLKKKKEIEVKQKRRKKIVDLEGLPDSVFLSADEVCDLIKETSINSSESESDLKKTRHVKKK